MKYSMRTLMIIVTLICVVLGGVMSRVEYLRRMAAFHQREAVRYRAIARSRSESPAEEREILWNAASQHFYRSRSYREAVRRPWTIVDNHQVLDPEPLK